MDNVARPIKLGIIGAGLAVEQLHWPALRQLTDKFTCVAVADTDVDHAYHIATTTGATQKFTDYRELLRSAEVEGVLISLPIHLQARALIDTIRAGKHVICEKPPASNLEQAQEVLRQAADAPVTVLIAENFRYRSDLVLARELIQSGKLGDVVMIKIHSTGIHDTGDPGTFASTPWRHDTQYRGGPVLDAGVHHAAALRDLGGPVEWVHGFAKYGGSRLGGTTTLAANVRFRSGALGSFVFSAVVHDEVAGFFEIKVYGTEATLIIRDQQIKVIRRGAEPETLPIPDFDTGYRGEFENFYGAIRQGEPVRATLAESCADLELIMRLLDASEQAQVMLL